MVALTDLICATSPDEYSELQSQFRAEQAVKPSDSEVLTAFMRGCTDFAGEPLLGKDEHVVLDGGKIVTRKLN